MSRITGANLANLPAEERAAIELDKRRWMEAHTMTQSKRPDEIRAWLAKMEEGDEKEDLRRRLNVIRLNRQAQIKNNEPSASQIKRTG